jgi:hypothetical protein
VVTPCHELLLDTVNNSVLPTVNAHCVSLSPSVFAVDDLTGLEGSEDCHLENIYGSLFLSRTMIGSPSAVCGDANWQLYSSASENHQRSAKGKPFDPSSQFVDSSDLLL